MLRLLAATGNLHKVEEFRSLLGPLSEQVELIPMTSIPGFPELVEDGKTFEENSGKKAVQASAYADMACFADDSGLEVDALNGEPGIYSARYAGPGASDADRIAKLLKNMEGKNNRKARFVCVVTIACRGEKAASFRGTVEGTIALSPRGNGGFGYDPVFIPDGFDKSFAELSPAEKDAVSHRGKAMRQAAEYIRHELENMDDFEFV